MRQRFAGADIAQVNEMREAQVPFDVAESWTARGLLGEVGRNILERSPRLFVEIARRRNSHRHLIDKSTDLVVEGFPRSGSTYLVSWLNLSNPHLKIASHLHSIAHIRSAIRQSIPVVLLLRPPREAVTSEYINRFGRDSPMSIPKLLHRYKHFYSQATFYAKDVTISPFECTTEHPELVTTTLCKQSEIELNTTPELGEDAVLEDVEKINTLHVGDSNELTVSRPSEARAELADNIKQHLSENYASTLERLQGLHDTLAASPSAVRWDS